MNVIGLFTKGYIIAELSGCQCSDEPEGRAVPSPRIGGCPVDVGCAGKGPDRGCEADGAKVSRASTVAVRTSEYL